MAVVRHKEAIHSGHFMVSNFEAEAQDDEEDIAVPVSERMILRQNVMAMNLKGEWKFHNLVEATTFYRSYLLEKSNLSKKLKNLVETLAIYLS